MRSVEGITLSSGQFRNDLSKKQVIKPLSDLSLMFEALAIKKLTESSNRRQHNAHILSRSKEKVKDKIIEFTQCPSIPPPEADSFVGHCMLPRRQVKMAAHVDIAH